MFKMGIRGWVFGATFYTVFDVASKLCQLYPNITNVIMFSGIIINITINYIFLNYFNEH